MSVTKQQAAALYAAVFNRAPDQAGLNYWIEQESFNVMAESFVAHPVFTEQYGDLDNQAFVEAIYENVLLGQGDAEGIEFWVGALDAGLSRGEFLASFIDASLNYDGDDAEALLRKDALVNKVTVGLYYTDTFGEATNFPADADIGSADIVNSPVYQKAAAAIENVTADPETVEAAKAEIDREAEGNEPDTLTEALENLKKAQADKTEFLEEAAENELVAAATGATTEAKIAAAVTAADVAVATVNYKDAADAPQTVIVYATTDSEGVKAAKIVDAQTLLEKNLTEANKVLDTAKADVAKVAGLSSAIDLFNSRVATQKETAETLKTATASQAGAVANYDSLNGNTTVPDITTGAVAGVLVVNAQSGRLELASGVTETTNPGVGALLSAVQARVDAAAANELALSAIESAVVSIGYLDITSGAKNDIGAAFDPAVTAGADSDKLTQAQVQVELNEQLAAAETANPGGLTFDGSGLITAPAPVPGDASTAYNDLKTVVNAFEATLVAGTAPDYTFATALKTKAQIDAQDGVETAENAIEALTEALSNLESANEVAEGLEAANKAIDDAEAVFEELGFEVPVTIEGTVIATAENDLFLMADDAGTIVNFNAQGEDSIYFGSEFGLLVLDTTQTINDRVGDADMFEVFAKQNGANVDLYVEQQTFAGNGLTEADIVKVTLTGVRVDELTLSDDGFLTLA